MSKRYNAKFSFSKDQVSDDEYEQILEEFEQVEQVEIETRKEDRGVARLSDPATHLALTAAGLPIHGTDVLLSMYQIARAHPAFVTASIQDENGESIETVGQDYIDAGVVDKEAAIGELNVEGDDNTINLYLVNGSDIDHDRLREAGTEREE